MSTYTSVLLSQHVPVYLIFLFLLRGTCCILIVSAAINSVEGMGINSYLEYNTGDPIIALLRLQLVPLQFAEFWRHATVPKRGMLCARALVQQATHRLQAVVAVHRTLMTM